MTTINEELIRTTAAAAAPGKRIVISDDTCTGFILRITDRGAISFWFKHQQDGKPVWVSLGAYSATFKCAQARIKANVYRGQVAATGKVTQADAKSPTVAGTKLFGDAVADFITDISRTHRAPRILESALQRPVAMWAMVPCCDITDDMAADLLRPMVEAGKGKRANAIQGALRTFFQWARQPGRKYVKTNPLAGVAKFGTGKGGKALVSQRDRKLDENEIRTLWLGLDDPAVLEQAKCPRRVALAIKLTLCTMLRSGEVVKGHRRELGQVKVGGSVYTLWNVPANRVKKDRNIEQPLNSLAQEIIAELGADGSDVFFPGNSSDGMMQQKTLQHIVGGHRKRLPGLCKVLGMQPFNMHDLRRTGSTLCNEQGQHIVNIKSKVELALDHRNTSDVGAIYDRSTGLAAKREVLDLLDRELRRIVATGGDNAVPIKRVA